ncbi:MAG: dioxygenase [Alphaproteobacteria bacterium]|nr:MAG: dioxygenase [Alphaproteobacteria bacterium]
MTRQPTLYITHGGGPCFWMDMPPPLGPKAYESLRVWFEGLLGRLPARPDAILVVSAHWEAARPTVASAERPGMLYDYYGFPPHTYELQYPAPGSPALAHEVMDLLAAAGIEAGADGTRGFDHAVFVPMLIIDPEARIPVVTLSLDRSLDAGKHLAIGRALEALRERNVLIVASGSSYHDLRGIFTPGPGASVAFDGWLVDTVALPDRDARDRQLVAWESAPGARACHPRAEHLIPLMVAAGAAGADAGTAPFRAVIGGKAYSCIAFGDFRS